MKRRIIQETKKLIHFEVKSILGKDIAELQDLMLEKYDGLSTWGYEPYSKANPDIYRDLFKEKLEKYEYFGEDKDGFMFSLPSMNSFDFSGMLVVQQILEGTIGEYYEISETTAKELDVSAVANKVPFGDSILTGDNYFLIEMDEILKTKLKAANKRLVKFPFSNTPPLETEIFDVVDKFAEDNDKKIRQAIEKSLKLAMQKYRRI